MWTKATRFVLLLVGLCALSHGSLALRTRPTFCQDGRTALMRAAFCKQVKSVTTLINKYKAKVDAEDNWGATALFFAIQEGHVDVVNALAGTFKANVEHGKKSKGERPLMTAALMGSVDIVNLLCSRHKADVNGQNNRGQTALMYACEEGRADIVQSLAGRHKARVDIRCSNGLMALHYAAINGKHEIVDMLIGKYGADVEAVTAEDKWTALHYAADGGSVPTVKVLVNKYDANTRAVDVFGTTPLEYAKENSDQAIVKILSDQSFVVYVKAIKAGSRSGEARSTGDVHDLDSKDDDANNEEVRLRINASTKAKRVIDVFCDKWGWNQEEVEFSFKGKPLSITGVTTIGDLGLKKNDCIEARLKISLGDKTMMATLDDAKSNLVHANDESPKAVVTGQGSTGQSSPTEEDKKAVAEREERERKERREEKERARKKREEEIARKLAEEEEALNKKFAEEAKKLAEEEAEQAKQRAIVEEAQRKAAAEEKARIEAAKAQKRAEEEERRKRLEEEEAARHKRYVAEKKAREKEEKALRKQKKREAELEAKAKLKALAKEKKEEQIKAEARAKVGPRVLVRPTDGTNAAKLASDADSTDPTTPIEALIKYAEEGNMLNVTSLINHQNVDVNAKHPETGITAVMAAARMGRVSTVKSLVKKSAKIEAVDNEGRTALMHAILGNQPAMVKDLLDTFHADASVKDTSGETPMSMAENLGLDAIIELIAAYKERVSQCQTRGKRASPIKPSVRSNGAGRGNRPVRLEPHDTRFALDRTNKVDGSDPRVQARDAGRAVARHHADAITATMQANGFFGDLHGGIGNALGGALEDGLDAPPEEDVPRGATFNPVPNGRDEWLQQSMFDAEVGLDIDIGANVDDVMDDLLKDIDYELNEANEINLVAEDVPLQFSNVGLGGLLASAPAPAEDPSSRLFEGIDAGGLFGPLLPAHAENTTAASRPAMPAMPITAQEIESRLRKPLEFDPSPSKPASRIKGKDQVARDLEDRERDEKLEKKFKTIRKERDELKKQLKAHERKLNDQEKWMKSMEGKIDKLLALLG